MSIKDGIFVTHHIQLTEPLDAHALARAKEIRWRWVVLYNHILSTKGGDPDYDAHLALAEQCIDMIDKIIAANPTIN